MPLSESMLVANAVSTLFMFGLIWVIQLVHYPLMKYAATSDFPAFERAHQRRITLLVGPAMLIELASGIALIVYVPSAVDVIWVWIGLALILINLISTATLQAPYHHKLQTGFDPRIWQQLVRTNWIRTVAWTCRSAVVGIMLVQTMDR